MHHAASWKWADYYWNLLKHFGLECYKTGRYEFWAGLIVALLTCVVTRNWYDYKTVLLTTAVALSLFAIWHLVHVPFILHSHSHKSEGNANPGVISGIFGIFVLVLMIVSSYFFIAGLWDVRPLSEIESHFVPQTPPTITIVHTSKTSDSKMEPNPNTPSPARVQPSQLAYAPPSPAPRTPVEILTGMNRNMFQDDKNRFSNALYDYSQILIQANDLGSRANMEGGRLSGAWQDGSLSESLDNHKNSLSSLAISAREFAKAFTAVRNKWNYFPNQTEYIFGDNPDNTGPNAIIDAANEYGAELDWWSKAVTDKKDRSALNLLQPQQIEYDNEVKRFIQWQQASSTRLDEMRTSIQ